MGCDGDAYPQEIRRLKGKVEAAQQQAILFAFLHLQTQALCRFE